MKNYFKRIILYINTIKYVKFSQILYRIKNACYRQAKSVKKKTGVFYIHCNLFDESLYPNSFLSRFSRTKESVSLLNEYVELDYSKISRYSPLIQFNTQYFEFAIAWALNGIDYSFFREVFESYIATNLPLDPYIISLQIPNLIITLNIYNIEDQLVYDELYYRYKWLINHQEKHLLANHYFENIKAIILGSYIFSENKTYKKYLKILKKECAEEILNDGIHFELSPMYHKIILEDLFLINKIAKLEWIDNYIKKMINASYSLEKGFNRTPLFNDSGDNVAKPLSALVNFYKKNYNCSPRLIDSFPNAGYYKLYSKTMAVMIDSGKALPNYNPGHAHCDCLSFELFNNNTPLFVNCGTYQYQGELRSYFRSTRCHNTLMADGHEQFECWKEHRVGKRIKRVNGSVVNNIFNGYLKNSYGEEFIRTIVLNDIFFQVLDGTKSITLGKDIYSYLHLAPGYCYKNGFIKGEKDIFRVETINCCVEAEEDWYSPEFGKKTKIVCLVFKWNADNNKHGYKIFF